MRLVSLALLLLACDGKGDTGLATGAPTGSSGPTAGSTSTAPLSHDADIQPVWENTCGSTCHVNDDDGGLNLSDAYDKIVGVPSIDVPSMNLVEPGEPENSYLWRKLEGTHIEAGGEGSTMPKGLSELGNARREKIRRWIEEGAAR